jgi:iron-sulfur cluster repair protein YtfE (RIC family)
MPASSDNPRIQSQELSREIVMENVAEALSAHHRACDELFLAAEGAAAEGRWPECKATIGAYRAEMVRHFDFEERILFPAFEQATGMTHGPTAVMREEHSQMLELIEHLVDAAARSHSEDYLAASETMLVLMQQHNLKEEGVLYPECDALLGSDDGAIAAGLRTLGVTA